MSAKIQKQSEQDVGSLAHVLNVFLPHKTKLGWRLAKLCFYKIHLNTLLLEKFLKVLGLAKAED